MAQIFRVRYARNFFQCPPTFSIFLCLCPGKMCTSVLVSALAWGRENRETNDAIKKRSKLHIRKKKLDPHYAKYRVASEKYERQEKHSEYRCTSWTLGSMVHTYICALPVSQFCNNGLRSPLLQIRMYVSTIDNGLAEWGYGVWDVHVSYHRKFEEI